MEAETGSGARDDGGHRVTSDVPPGTMKARTVAARRTLVQHGQLVCVPFPTSTKPFKRDYPSSIAFGVTGGPSSTGSTVYRDDYNGISRTPQSAASPGKIAIPYKMHAARSRVINDPPKPPLPFSSSIVFGGDLLNKPTRRWSTINSICQPHASRPMTQKIGFTNADITSNLSRRLHSVVYK